jgi:lactate permease
MPCGRCEWSIEVVQIRHELRWALPGVSSRPAPWPSCSSCERSQVMQASAMTASLGAAAAALSSRYVWISPWLAGLGAWLTGSNLGGTAMFALLQKAAASRTGLSLLWLAAVQNGAGQLARMLSPACLLLAATSAGLNGQESLLLRTCGPLVLWTIALQMLVLAGVLTPSPLVLGVLVVLLLLPCVPRLRAILLALPAR